MSSGPPPSEAGPSNYASTDTSHNNSDAGKSSSHNPVSGQTYTGSFQTHPNATPYYTNIQPTGYNSQWSSHTNGAPNHSYYNYPPTWNGNLPPGYQYPHPGPIQYASQPPTYVLQTPPKSVTPPPLPYHKHWDEIIKSFLVAAGLTQALRGFESDMIMMSDDHEQKVIPPALNRLKEDIERIHDIKPGDPEHDPLDERKLSYVHLANDAEPRTPSAVIKSISHFLAQNRARNDASNRQEFLLSLAEKRQRLGHDENADPGPTCARTDAKTQNRDIQMKYDIAKNEDGPLRKTMKLSTDPDGNKQSQQNIVRDDIPTVGRYPTLDDRLKNVETHLAVKYVPSPPRSLLDRLRFLEDHLIHLEKEYPPWAALHFNQPRRGWPPPPRPTPIIVPSHLTSSTPVDTSQVAVKTETNAASADNSTTPSSNSKTNKGKSTGRQKSSLHRAVMERLEVQKAMNDLAGTSSAEGNVGSTE
ncbi:hypothetical protein QCA50_003971 [Cerrena zonata]|uniref:Uncharacterized protein n=1 Tax=Cerrena zonata TaxID=2478898 RepID=A0AAW0GFZ9_9APHY